MVTKPLRVRIVAFAQAREALGTHDRTIELPRESTVEQLCERLASERPELREILATMRVARNGRVAARSETLASDDEVALLPPVGGG